MNTEMISLVASGVALAFSAHLTAKALVERRKEKEPEVSEDDLDPFNLEAKPQVYDEGRLSAFGSLMRTTDVEELSQLRQLLNYAGKRNPIDLELYHTSRGVTLVGSVALSALLIYTQVDFSVQLAMLLIAIGVLGPKKLLTLRGEARQTEIKRSLPHTLDLIITCMEAGLNFEQALDRVTREIKMSDPALADEFTVVLQELNAGLSVSAAIKKLSQRVSSEELRNLCNVIVQSVTLGSSLGRAMREYAASGRRKRELHLEEDAGNVTAKLTLPLTICLLPSAMLAMLAPAVVTILESMM